MVKLQQVVQGRCEGENRLIQPDRDPSQSSRVGLLRLLLLCKIGTSHLSSSSSSYDAARTSPLLVHDARYSILKSYMRKMESSCRGGAVGATSGLGLLVPYTTGSTTIALLRSTLPSFAMATPFRLELRKLIHIHMPWKFSQTHASLRIAFLQDFSTFRPSLQLRDVLSHPFWLLY